MMDKSARDDELAALIHMTRFMADAVDRVVADPQKLREQLGQLEAELQAHLQHADANASRRAN
jgi:uncharacterized protein YigA (DUF484 family)